jgi:hypothetical protein
LQAHTPPPQVSPAVQALPQPPQFCGSVCSSTQLVPQIVLGAGQVMQLPLTQLWAITQATPQAPQFC